MENSFSRNEEQWNIIKGRSAFRNFQDQIYHLGNSKQQTAPAIAIAIVSAYQKYRINL